VSLCTGSCPEDVSLQADASATHVVVDVMGYFRNVRLPLFVAAYAVAVWQYSPNKLSTYQTIAMILGGAAGAITVAGTATGTIPADSTPVTSTAANGAIVSVPAAGLTASMAAGGALVAGIGKEVANATDVSTITVRVIFIGE